MTHSNLSDKIEAWLDGKLPEKESRSFEAEIAANAQLAEEVKGHRLARRVLDHLAAQSLQQDFSHWRETLDDIPEPPDDPPLPYNPYRWSSWVYKMALLLILSAGAIWYFWPSPSQEPPVQTQPSYEKEKPVEPIAQQAPDTPPAPAQTPEIKQPPSPAPNRPIYNRELVALAQTGLEKHRQSVSMQYGQVMGPDDDDDPHFAAGLQAYQDTNNRKAEAIRQFRKIPAADSSYYAAAQELLALLYFDSKNFPAAARAYEAFAAEFSSPEADWRLSQYYLAAYDTRKADFWKKMNEMLDPATEHRYKPQAEALKKTLEEKGMKE